MSKVTKESLAENIGRLESYGDLSINEEYQLKAYRMLLRIIEQAKVVAEWPGADYYSSAVELYHSDGLEFGKAVSELADIVKGKAI